MLRYVRYIRLVMGGSSKGRSNVGLVNRPALSENTHLVGYGPLLVCRCVPLLSTAVTQGWTEDKC